MAKDLNDHIYKIIKLGIIFLPVFFIMVEATSIFDHSFWERHYHWKIYIDICYGFWLFFITGKLDMVSSDWVFRWRMLFIFWVIAIMIISKGGVYQSGNVYYIIMDAIVSIIMIVAYLLKVASEEYLANLIYKFIDHTDELSKKHNALNRFNDWLFAKYCYLDLCNIDKINEHWQRFGGSPDNLLIILAANEYSADIYHGPIYKIGKPSMIIQSDGTFIIQLTSTSKIELSERYFAGEIELADLVPDELKETFS